MATTLLVESKMARPEAITNNVVVDSNLPHINTVETGVPLPPTLEEKLAIFEQELTLFKSSATMLDLELEQEQLANQTTSNGKEYDTRFVDLESALTSAREARKKAQARRDRTLASYKMNYASKKALIYDTLRFFRLNFIANRLFPIDSSKKDFANKSKAEYETQREIDRTLVQKLERQAALERQRANLAQELQERTENWAVETRDRVLMYALRNPARADALFTRFAVQSDQEKDSLLKSLQAEYSQLGDKNLSHIGETAKSIQYTEETSTNSKKDNQNNGSVSQEKQGKQEEESIRRPIIIEGINSSTRIESTDQLRQILQKSGSEIQLDDLLTIIDKLSSEDALQLLSRHKKRAIDPGSPFKGYHVVGRGKLGRILFSIDTNNHLHIRIAKHTDIYGGNIRQRKLK